MQKRSPVRNTLAPNPLMRNWVVLILMIGLALFASVSIAQDTGTVVIDGLNGPMGVLVDEDGVVWVIDSGIGGDTEIPYSNPQTGEAITAKVGDTARVIKVTQDGAQSLVANLASLSTGSDILGGSRLVLVEGVLYATTGQWLGSAESEALSGVAGVVKIQDGEVSQIASTWDFERQSNPDNVLLDSHPYGMIAGPDGNLWVTDAAANDLLRINPVTGKVSLVAVFDPVPAPFPNPERGNALVTDPVPTAIAIGQDGRLYVSFLPGFPFTPGSAKVVTVDETGVVADYATGLTMLTDLRLGPDGNLYAVQFAEVIDQGPQPNSGALIRIQEGERSEVVLNNLAFPTSVDFNANGDVYLTINGVGAPGSGQVVMYAGLIEAPTDAVIENVAENFAEAPPKIATEDQASDGTTILVNQATSPQQAWVVIHEDDGDTPGPVLGYAMIAAGENQQVSVTLNEPLAASTKLWAVLHQDAGVLGVFEFPGPDMPVMVGAEDVVISNLFTATVAARNAQESVATATAPDVTVVDQASNGQTVVISQIVAAQQSWAVIHVDDGGKPGPVLGQTNVAPGVTANVVVSLAEPLTAETILWAMLHVDEGASGVYEFPGADAPVILNNQVVMAPFAVTPSATAVATASSATPGTSVLVNDQPSNGSSVTIAESLLPQAGWVVIHADQAGKPGPVLGQSQISPGLTQGVIVQLTEPIVGAVQLWAMLHLDAGVAGVYEFPGPDAPVMVEGEVVMSPFTATAPDKTANQVGGSNTATEGGSASNMAPEAMPATGASMSASMSTTLPVVLFVILLLALNGYTTRRRVA